MSEFSVPAVVPAGRFGSGVAPVSRSGEAAPMPLAGLAPVAGAASMLSAIASVDGRGRIADRSVVHALGRQAGRRLGFRPVEQTVVVRPDSAGLFTVTGQGYVRLPAPVRHWCGFAAGDRTLVVARPDQDVLVVHPMAVVEALLVAQHIALGVGTDEH